MAFIAAFVSRLYAPNDSIWTRFSSPPNLRSSAKTRRSDFDDMRFPKILRRIYSENDNAAQSTSALRAAYSSCVSLALITFILFLFCPVFFSIFWGLGTPSKQGAREERETVADCAYNTCRNKPRQWFRATSDCLSITSFKNAFPAIKAFSPIVFPLQNINKEAISEPENTF